MTIALNPKAVVQPSRLGDVGLQVARFALVVIVRALPSLWVGIKWLARRGRHLPILWFVVLRWRRLAVGMNMGHWKLIRHQNAPNRKVPRGTPWLTHAIATEQGFGFQLWMPRGYSTGDLVKRQAAMTSACRGQVRISQHPKHENRAIIRVQRRDVFKKPVPPPTTISPTQITVGLSNIGRPYLIDFRLFPHYLTTGVTDSGKSCGHNAIFWALCPTPAAFAIIDLKWGVSATPMIERASEIAMSKEQAVRCLETVRDLCEVRAELCKLAGVDSVYGLEVRPREVFIAVDEVAELISGTNKVAKELAAAASALLLSGVQLGRAFGIHFLIAGQRVGSATGLNATGIRAQLAGRQCFRVTDSETADMTLGDVDSQAAAAALRLNPDGKRPGMAVVTGGAERWQIVRFAHVTPAMLKAQAEATKDLRVGWSELIPESRQMVLDLKAHLRGDVQDVIHLAPQDWQVLEDDQVETA